MHLTDDAFRYLNQHVAAPRFYTGFTKELKIPPGNLKFPKPLEPIRSLAQEGAGIWASVVYVDKLRYTGPYLKQVERPASSLRFRNFILRLLLERHFQNYPIQSLYYNLVLDRVDLTRKQADNLWHYLYGNLATPNPSHITHASSIYVEGLQVVHHIAEGFKEALRRENMPPELTFVNPRDLTHSQEV